ncbi:MAG: molybdopterin-guanine dinucleotide biosynthesis protein B [Elusimicrobia bacterium]|nr:molybdopterin-guanine dinucleotide biosynthesis protein B [Elusimicrobiota bacterium]
MAVPSVSFVGRSGSGKTTLLVKVVRALARKGYRVGTVKHFRRGFETDQPGKDSYRHFHAGAAASLIASGDKLALVKRLSRPLRLRRIVTELFPDMDLVVTEGFKGEPGPKIEVLRRAVSREPVCPPRGRGLIALVCDFAVPGYPQPRFRSGEAGRIARFIEKEIL